ncbi:MAG: hypothetical protein JRJ79_05640 [Deltaproteobacteria bacterium]|nr:hypothetical protein [Deltaproteobacteria bacterium]MBW1794695.1 hypothetical protein [Deltaproteobacteria bacterium]
MPIDWDAIDSALDEAKEETDEALATRISSLTKMTDAEVQELFPSLDEKKKLAELMRIVNSATAENEKVNRLADNIETVGSAVIRLLVRFV